MFKQLVSHLKNNQMFISMSNVLQYATFFNVPPHTKSKPIIAKLLCAAVMRTTKAINIKSIRQWQPKDESNEKKILTILQILSQKKYPFLL